MKKLTGENILLLERRYKQATLLSLSLAGSLIALTFVSVWIEAPFFALEKQVSDTFWVLVIFLAGGAFILRRMFNRWDRIKDLHLLKGLDGVLKTLRRDASLLSVIGFAIGILGFVIFLSNGSISDLLRSVVVALVVIFFVFPRKKIWNRIAIELEGI